MGDFPWEALAGALVGAAALVMAFAMADALRGPTCSYCRDRGYVTVGWDPEDPGVRVVCPECRGRWAEREETE